MNTNKFFTKKYPFYYGAIALMFFFCACSNPRYINSPSVHNAAFLKQQGDFKISAAGAVNPATVFKSSNDNDKDVKKSYGFDGQAAVAVSNHFFVAAGGMFRNEKDRFADDDIVNYTRNMFDVGAGFYTPMGQSGKVYFNGLLGVGLGYMSSKDNILSEGVVNDRSFKANLIKYNIHPSFNFFFNDYFRMSVAPKFSILKLNNVKSTYSETEEISLGYKDARKRTFGLFEPAILLQTGFRNNDWLKLDFAFNFVSDPFTTRNSGDDARPESETYNVQSRNFLFSIGLSFYPQIKNN